jgi:2-polyprenyl-3-methyl-5-hydroxy-6-metoxy-1,4-benzoquinol methylase
MPKSFFFKTKNNKTVSIEIPEPGNFSSCYIFGIHQSGSTLINRIFKDVCRELKMPFVAPEEQLFSQGTVPSFIVNDMSPIFLNRGFFYLGFRSYWIGNHNVELKGNKCILLVRDPRDSIVSHFFSSKYSHVLPKSGVVKDTMEKLRSELMYEAVSKYVLRENIVNLFVVNHEQYYRSLPRESTRIYRYEDVIFFKREWLMDMLNFLGIELPSERIDQIAARHNLIPDKEQPDKFVRQVIPGNYKKHLSQPIINKLNKRFNHILSWYGYDTVRFMRLETLKQPTPKTEKKVGFGPWCNKVQTPGEINPLFLEEEAEVWAEEMRALIESDKSEEVQRIIQSKFGQEIDEQRSWYQRIEFQKFGISTTSNHSRVIETPGSLNRIGGRLTPMEATLVRPFPKWKYIERVLPDVKGKSVLEIGCANGFFSKKFAQLGAEKVTGIELIAAQVKAARWAANILGLDQVTYLNTDVLTDQSIKQHDIVFLSEVHNHFPLPFLGFLRLVNLAKEFIVFDNSGTITNSDNTMRYEVMGNPARDKINFIHCNISENLMIQFLNVIGIDNEMIVAYVSPVNNTHVLYLIDVRNMRDRRAEIHYPEYLKMVFERF